MTPEQLRLDEANRWLTLAARDLNSARLLAEEEPSGSLFHSQQAAEKTAKAFLAFHNAAFRKTHDLKELGAQCAALEPALSPLFQDAADLTEYAVVFRYLDAPREPDPPEATRGIEVARRLFSQVRLLLNISGQQER